MHFFDFNVIRQPEVSSDYQTPSPEMDLLVLYLAGEERLEFLTNILKAAGFQQPEQTVSLLAVDQQDIAIDLATLLLRSPQLKRILIFGLNAKALGLHLQLGHYVPVQLNGRTFMLADDLETISEEKAGGRPQKAAALWQAVKTEFSART